VVAKQALHFKYWWEFYFIKSRL